MSDQLIVLIDDVRWFRDARPCLMARSSAKGITLLRSLAGQRIDQLWLDHDLGGDDTVMPVIDLLCEDALEVGVIYVHSFNAKGAVVMRQRLAAAGYRVAHSYDVRMWVHENPKVSDPGARVKDEGGRS
jgi:hypothetical protein